MDYRTEDEKWDDFVAVTDAIEEKDRKLRKAFKGTDEQYLAALVGEEIQKTFSKEHIQKVFDDYLLFKKTRILKIKDWIYVNSIIGLE